MRLDPIANHPGKADVSLINASDVTELSLFVPEAKAEVFSGIAEQEMATRAVTAPLTLDFEFRAAGQTLATLTDIQLNRKSGVTFLLMGKAGDYTAIASPNRYVR
jgi:hypothetical protein